jgi:uncharacterized protein
VLKYSMDLEQLKPKIIEALKQYDPQVIAVFGSYARGEQTPNSDIDLIVRFGVPLGFRFFGIPDALEKELGVKVDLMTPEGVNKHVLPYIKKDLKIIYQDPKDEEGLQSLR